VPFNKEDAVKLQQNARNKHSCILARFCLFKLFFAKFKHTRMRFYFNKSSIDLWSKKWNYNYFNKIDNDLSNKLKHVSHNFGSIDFVSIINKLIHRIILMF